jgi:hypothetical protein
MAVVALTTGTMNADNLFVRYGTNEATVQRGGDYKRLADGQHIVSVIVDLATLPTAASGNEQIVAEGVLIPNGALISKIRVTVLEEPTTSGSPNLDFGLVDQDRSTEIDFNGFLAAADAFETGTDLGAVVEYVKGTTEAGALVGTVLTNTGLLTCSADTADWTDGTVRLDVEYYMPLTADL